MANAYLLMGASLSATAALLHLGCIAFGPFLRLPLLRTGLCVITGIYLLRGIAGFWLAAMAPGERSVAFWCWSSVICLAIGALYLVGTRQTWAALSRGTA